MRRALREGYDMTPTQPTIRTGQAPAYARRLARFRDEEDGSFVIVGLLLFLAIILVGGLSVDIMRHDYNRVMMQNTLDAAVLAAADRNQQLDAKAVVRDHFAKAGISDRLDDVKVVTNFNSKIVTAEASTDVSTIFLPAVGIDRIPALVGGTAREDVGDIEVSMVLDVSGSMGSNSRLKNLKKAAVDFVDRMIPTETDGTLRGKTSISIVPYAEQVNIGANVLKHMNKVQQSHDDSACVDFRSTDFSTPALDDDSVIWQTARFDPWSTAYNSGDYRARRWGCRSDAASRALILGDDPAVLKAHINAMTDDGNTSSDIGLKWGAAFLDPGMEEVVDGLVDDKVVAAKFKGRPWDYDDTRVKVIVLMTDGANTSQHMMNPAYAGDNLSNVWARWVDGKRIHSVFVPQYDSDHENRDADEHWWLPHERKWARKSEGGTEFVERKVEQNCWWTWWGGWQCSGPRTDNWDVDWAGGELPPVKTAGSDVRLTWQELWKHANTDWFADYGYARQWDRDGDSTRENEFLNAAMVVIGGGTKDSRMEQMCTEIKKKGVIIFSVAFETTDNHAAKVKNCATSENHFFRAKGTEIVTAFSAIASTVNQLRLSQ